MGRVPRVQASEIHYHVIVRCNNKEFLFQANEDFQLYLNVLRETKKRHGFVLYNYELMHSHVHLFMQPSFVFSLSRTMHAINKRFSLLYNKIRGRKGHFWVDRYKNIPVEQDRHALALMRYINRNAVRAGIVKKLGEWQYSGYRFYANGEPNDLLDFHPSYLMLGENATVRQEQFRDLISQVLPSDDKRQPQFSNSSYIGSKYFGKRLGFEK